MTGFLAAGAEGGMGSFFGIMVVYIVVIGVAMYFISYPPQNKPQKNIEALHS